MKVIAKELGRDESEILGASEDTTKAFEMGAKKVLDVLRDHYLERSLKAEAVVGCKRSYDELCRVAGRQIGPSQVGRENPIPEWMLDSKRSLCAFVRSYLMEKGSEKIWSIVWGKQMKNWLTGENLPIPTIPNGTALRRIWKQHLEVAMDLRPLTGIQTVLKGKPRRWWIERAKRQLRTADRNLAG